MLELSASVSVSVSSPGGFDRLAGLPEREKTRTDSSPESFSAKWTFFGPAGVLGADCARRCFDAARGRSRMFGEDEEDFKEGFRGLPLDRMMGVLGVRGSEEAEDARELAREGVGMNGEVGSVGESGDDFGKGTEPGARESTRAPYGISMREGGSTLGLNLPAFMDRRRELVGGRGEM